VEEPGSSLGCVFEHEVDDTQESGCCQMFYSIQTPGLLSND
jgi:hypothetical protein